MPNSQQRKYVLAGVNKADYICRCLLDDNYDVEVISPNVALNGEFLPAELRRYQDGLKHKLFTSLRAKSKIGRAFRRIYMQCALFAYLVKSVKREEPLIVYHSLYYCGLVRWVKRITKCKLILEVEEIYSDAMGSSSRRREKEVHFFQHADAYIFPTELLAESINTDAKEQIIAYGNYHCAERYENKRSDGMIHCVYAGTLGLKKGGAAAAVAAARYLPERYAVHVLGEGTGQQMRELLIKIDQTNQESQCRVTYDGVLTGEKFSQFLQSCQIGLSTQNPNGAFNDTSFPSKILTYLCNGLKVVSVRIPVVERSAISGAVTFYEEQTPEAIADAILKVKLDGKDSKDLIRQLDLKCKKELAQLIG